MKSTIISIAFGVIITTISSTIDHAAVDILANKNNIVEHENMNYKIKPCDTVSSYNKGYIKGVKECQKDTVKIHDTILTISYNNIMYSDTKLRLWTKKDSLYYHIIQSADTTTGRGKINRVKIKIKK